MQAYPTDLLLCMARKVHVENTASIETYRGGQSGFTAILEDGAVPPRTSDTPAERQYINEGRICFFI